MDNTINTETLIIDNSKTQLLDCLIEKLSKENTVVIFYSSYCGYSIRALELLRTSNYKYKGYDLEKNNIDKNYLLEILNNDKLIKKINLDKESIERLKNHTTRPIIFLNNKFIGGCSELEKFLINN